MEEVAEVYARALFGAARDHEALDEVHEQLGQFAQALGDNRDLMQFFFSPYFSSEEKKDALGRAVTDADPRFLNFLEALIERMSSQELINNLGAMKRHGVLRDPNLKALVDLKLEEAQMGSRVSALKADRALKATDLSDDVRQKLEVVADVQIKAKGRITRPVALLVDKSGSMDVAIEMGKRIGALISAVCEADLFVYAFDTMAYPIEPTGPKLAGVPSSRITSSDRTWSTVFP